jgi:hypothetical protein
MMAALGAVGGRPGFAPLTHDQRDLLGDLLDRLLAGGVASSAVASR